MCMLVYAHIPLVGQVIPMQYHIFSVTFHAFHRHASMHQQHSVAVLLWLVID
jgi:hypothetical protein